jgi:hypothetical protein
MLLCFLKEEVNFQFPQCVCACDYDTHRTFATYHNLNSVLSVPISCGLVLYTVPYTDPFDPQTSAISSLSPPPPPLFFWPSYITSQYFLLRDYKLPPQCK